MNEGTNILLVDDEPGMLRYIRTLLEVDDYKVETASTGEEALERVEKGLEPELVLLDVRTGLVPFTPPFNVTGQPAISLPLSWNAEGLPIGAQLVSAFGREDVLLRVAAQLEQAQPWADRVPPVHAS